MKSVRHYTERKLFKMKKREKQQKAVKGDKETGYTKSLIQRGLGKDESKTRYIARVWKNTLCCYVAHVEKW